MRLVTLIAFLLICQGLSAAEINYFSILRVHPKSSESEVIRAYRVRVRETHPDQNPGSDGKEFICVREAYEVLVKKKKAPAYLDSACKPFESFIDEPKMNTQEKIEDRPAPSTAAQTVNTLSTSQSIMVELQAYARADANTQALEAYMILEKKLNYLLIKEFGQTLQIDRVTQVLMDLISKTGLIAQWNLGSLELYVAISRAVFMFIEDKISPRNRYVGKSFYEKSQMFYKANLAYMRNSRDSSPDLRRAYTAILDFSVIYQRTCDRTILKRFQEPF